MVSLGLHMIFIFVGLGLQVYLMGFGMGFTSHRDLHVIVVVGICFLNSPFNQL